MKLFPKKILCLLLLPLFIAGAYVFLYKKATTPLTLKDKKVTVEIKRGESVLSITDKLKKRGVIEDKYVFLSWVLLEGNWSELKPGTYTLSSSLTTKEVAYVLKKGVEEGFKITIPEGKTITQIEKIISEKLQKEIEIENKKITDYQDQYFVLSSAPKENSLEGFLFPDTYFFDKDSDSQEIIKRMIQNLEKKTLEKEINEENFYEVLIMASLLEKEIRTKEEKQMVAGILWKRLNVGMPLQVDATVSYAKDKFNSSLLKKDYEIDSPYNTYKNRGLPPAPICSPGIESIQAAIDPIATNFWYYLSTKEGDTIFNETLEGHNQAKLKYLKNE